MKNNIKMIGQFLMVLFISTLWWWLIGSAIVWDLNPLNWMVSGRIVIVLLIILTFNAINKEL